MMPHIHTIQIHPLVLLSRRPRSAHTPPPLRPAQTAENTLAITPIPTPTPTIPLPLPRVPIDHSKLPIIITIILSLLPCAAAHTLAAAARHGRRGFRA